MSTLGKLSPGTAPVLLRVMVGGNRAVFKKDPISRCRLGCSLANKAHFPAGEPDRIAVFGSFQAIMRRGFASRPYHHYPQMFVKTGH